MGKNYYKIVEEKILKQIDSKEYKKAYAKTEIGKVDRRHFLEVAKLVSDIWEENEKTKIPMALKIAGLCHDSDRAYPKRRVRTDDYPEGQYVYRKGIHSGNTALLFFENNLELPKTLVKDVCFLILRHEQGGDRNSRGKLFEVKDEFTKKYNLNLAADYLYYADKLSFFYSNIEEYSKRGKEKLKKKILYSVKGLPKKITKRIKKIKFDNKLIEEVIREIL